MRKVAFFSYWLCFLTLAAPGAQIGAQQQASTPLATLTFELFHNRVYLPVEVNRHKLSMVLDTGAAFSGLSQAIVQTLQLQIKGKAQLVGNGESPLSIALTKNVSFKLGEVELLEKSVAIVPFQDLEAHEGRTIAGVLGVDLFRRYVVVIDYATRTLTLYQPENFLYHGAGEIVPLHFGKAALFQAKISIPGHDPITANLAVDSGAYSALRLYRPFAQKHRLLELQTSLVDSFGFGIGGEFPEKLGRVGTLEIGTLKLHEPVASFSDAKGGATASDAYDGTIGGALLSRFKVTFDYSRQQMILEPNPDFPASFQADTAGLILQASGNDLEAISIRHVLANTPAALAGIREGDVVVSVNGREAQSLGLEALRNLLCQGGVYRLQLQREQHDLKIDMTTNKPLY